MPFEVLETITKRNTPPVASLSYMRPVHKGKPAKSGTLPVLRIGIPTTICGVSKSEHWFLLLGSGDDLGKLRVVGNLSGTVKQQDGGTTFAQLKHQFRWNFGHIPRLGDEIFDGERFPVRRITDEVYEITMPAGFFPVQDPAASSLPKTGSAVKRVK